MFFFKFIMIRLSSRDHPAANPFPPLRLCPAAGQRGRGGEGLAEVELPHIFQDGVSPFAPALSEHAVSTSLPPAHRPDPCRRRPSRTTRPSPGSTQRLTPPRIGTRISPPRPALPHPSLQLAPVRIPLENRLVHPPSCLDRGAI